MIEYTLMDCNGKPVTIEDGLKFWHEPDDGQRWNSTTLQFEDDDDEDEDRLYFGCCGDDDRADKDWASLEHWNAVY